MMRTFRKIKKVGYKKPYLMDGLNFWKDGEILVAHEDDGWFIRRIVPVTEEEEFLHGFKTKEDAMEFAEGML